MGEDLSKPGSRRRWVLGATVALGTAVVAAVVLVWFQPQKLWIDERVSEPTPTVASAAPSGPSAGPPSGPPPEPVELARGQLVSRDHDTSGLARVLTVEGGRRILRLEGLDTSNGPDLFVYLTANPAGGVEGAFDDEFVNLGRLKGNKGDQGYDVAPEVDLGRFRTVVIWCDRFDSAFGAADLATA